MQTTKCYRCQNLGDPIDNIKHVLLGAQTSDVNKFRIIRGASSDLCNKGTS